MLHVACRCFDFVRNRNRTAFVFLNYVVFLLENECLYCCSSPHLNLHTRSSNGHMRIVKLLLRAGAAVNSENSKGQVGGMRCRANSVSNIFDPHTHTHLSITSGADRQRMFETRCLTRDLPALQTPVDLAFQLNFNDVGE